MKSSQVALAFAILTAFAGDHRPVDGYMEVTRSTDIYCFGSVLDNTTNDPTTMPPR